MGRQPFEIVLASIERMSNPYAGGQSMGLQYHMPRGAPAEPKWREIVDLYALILKAGAALDRVRQAGQEGSL